MKLSIIAIIALGITAAFMSGRAYEYYSIQPTIIEYQGGHFDMITGKFTWGKAPAVYDPEMMANQLSESVMPAKKAKGAK